jgi:Na+-driven multidrug efflux pump
VNVVLSLDLVFGYAGLPELGIVGAGLGTVGGSGFALLPGGC